MRIITSLLLILLGNPQIFAQIEAKAIDYNNKLEVNLPKEVSSHSFANALYSVNVIDVRDDTAIIGYHYLKESDARRYFVKPGPAPKNKHTDAWSKVYQCSSGLKEGFTQWINEYLQCQKNGSAKNKLLIVVKKFWLSGEANKIRYENDKIGQAMNGWDPGVLCKLEFYLEKDSVFFPLYRVDSIYTFKKRLNDYEGIKFVDNADFFITSALKASLEKLNDINFDEIPGKRRKLSYDDIYKEYSKKNELAALKLPGLKKGVYKNFEDFKAGTPSITEYEFRKGTAGDILYIKEDGSAYPARNAWGFCDGTDIFINSGDKYSKLVRRENTFYFLGIKGMVQRSKHIFGLSSGFNYATNTGPKESVYKLDLKYYQLDMETGEVY